MPSTQLESFLKERYEKDEQYFRVYDSYRPNFNRPIITGKFYSKYQTLDLDLADLGKVEEIKKHNQALPREKYSWPVTENQCYGWFNTPLVEFDRLDERFYNPMIMCAQFKHETKLNLERKNQKDKFAGIPFKLK